MRMPVRSSVLVLCLGAGLASAPVWATNGYTPHGFSAKEKGRAGTGAAWSADTIAAGNNPAGMVFQGDRLDVGADLFSPHRTYTAGNPGPNATFPLAPQSVDSDQTAFVIPHFGYNHMLDPMSSVGVSVYGSGGMNTDFDAPAPGVFGAGATGVDLKILFAGLTYARKINNDSAWGATLVFAYSQFKAEGLGAFGQFGFSTDPNNLTNNGTASATGFGLKAGWQGPIAPDVRLGISYQTETDMSEFDEYAGLFAEGGDFDLPAMLNLGVAWEISPERRFLVDLQQIYYSGIKSINNTITPLLTACNQNDQSGCLGGSNGAGFGWDDMTVLKFGYEWDAANDWTWRLGLSHADQPIPESEVLFNILAPGVVETHLTGGFTRQLGGDSELTFHAMYAPNTSVKGTSPFGDGQQIEIEMNQYELGLSYAKRF